LNWDFAEENFTQVIGKEAPKATGLKTKPKVSGLKAGLVRK
jgi:hypothetical protein